VYRTSEFDAKPVTLRIFGSAAPATKNPVLEEIEIPKTALQQSKLMNTRVRMNRLQQVRSSTATTVDVLSAAPTYRMADAEKQFMVEYDAIDEFSKEKGIRFMVCTGDERTSKDLKNSLIG
jgi:hypothetical protein